MEDMIDFKGYFKLDCIDASGCVIDSYEDKNMIMVGARTSMAEIFANLTASTSINHFALGTMGHDGANLLAPKTSAQGFLNTRDRMFCESGGSKIITDVIAILNINDVYFFSDVSTTGYYRYIKASTTSYIVSDVLISDPTEWEFLHATVAPYLYNVTFDLPADSQTAEITADNIVEDDAASGSTVLVHQTGTSLTFNIEIVPAAGNLQDLVTSVFTEAALYANGRIFSMKTFKSKIKDSTVSLKVTWTITF